MNISLNDILIAKISFRRKENIHAVIKTSARSYCYNRRSGDSYQLSGKWKNIHCCKKGPVYGGTWDSCSTNTGSDLFQSCCV